jgi:hypothetical protein
VPIPSAHAGGITTRSNCVRFAGRQFFRFALSPPSAFTCGSFALSSGVASSMGQRLSNSGAATAHWLAGSRRGGLDFSSRWPPQ